MKLLLTAFDPFGGSPINPAQEALALLPDRVGGAALVKLVVPTVFGDSIDVLTAAIRREQPDAVLCLGQAGGRTGLTPERVAINLNDARIPDNAGNQPIDTPVAEGGPAAYFSTLPVKAMTSAIRRAGVPASVSNTAGTFVCNHLMYGLLHFLAQECPGIRGGFLHVPYLPNQTKDAPALPLEAILRGIEAAIAAIAEHPQDITAPEGMLH